MATSISFLEQMLLNTNIQAALKVVRHTEGTSAEDGYNYLYGSMPHNDLRFTDMSTHPNSHQNHNGIVSTAAGAYQILYGTFTELCNKYGFKDFSPHTQDLMCLAIFDMINVLASVAKGGMLQEPVLKALSGQWASLPLSPYGQPTHSIADVRAYYLQSGGSLPALA